MFNYKPDKSRYKSIIATFYINQKPSGNLPDGFSFLKSDYAFAVSFSYAAITAEISTLRASALMGWAISLYSPS